jgi:hypothetical protein
LDYQHLSEGKNVITTETNKNETKFLPTLGLEYHFRLLSPKLSVKFLFWVLTKLRVARANIFLFLQIQTVRKRKEGAILKENKKNWNENRIPKEIKRNATKPNSN